MRIRKTKHGRDARATGPAHLQPLLLALRPPDLSAGAALAAAVEQAWSLVVLDGAPVTVPAERARPTLAFEAEMKRVSGMAGVNRFGGSYTLEGRLLKFGPLMATKMAGAPELNELETRFLRALEVTTAWRVGGGELELLAAERPVARFRALNR